MILFDFIDVAEALYLALISDPYAIGELTCSKAMSHWTSENVLEKISAMAGGSGYRTDEDLKDRADVLMRCAYTTTQPSFDEGLNLLTSSQWLDAADDTIRIRDRLSLLFDIDFGIIPQPSLKKKAEVKESEPKDELESYSSLVREAGY